MPSSTASTSERPHQALGMQVPGRPSTRRRRARTAGCSELDYPFHDWTGTVTHCGRICYKGRKVNLSQRLRRAERRRPAGERPDLARHLHGLRSGLLRRRDVPARADRESVRPESVTHVSGMNCHPCDRNGPVPFQTGVTVHTSEHIGDTLALRRRGACRGRSVTLRTSVFGSLPPARWREDDPAVRRVRDWQDGYKNFERYKDFGDGDGPEPSGLTGIARRIGCPRRSRRRLFG